MAPRRLKRSTHLVLDFDGTITVNDTMAILGRLSKNPPVTWDAIFDAYMKDYQVFKETPFPWKKYDEVEYSDWLRSRKWVEQRSAQRAQDAGFFQGVTLGDVNRTVGTAFDDGSLQLRDGWLDLFEMFIPSDAEPTLSTGKISIISVNWCENFIRRAMMEAARRSDHEFKHAIERYVSNMEIHANNLQGLHKPKGSSGVLCRQDGLDIRTSDDKLRYMPDVSQVPADETLPLVVYLGDSSTDFDCLLEAHVGVWIHACNAEGYQQAFKETFRPFEGFVPQPLSNEEIVTDAICWSPGFEQVKILLMKQS